MGDVEAYIVGRRRAGQSQSCMAVWPLDAASGSSYRSASCEASSAPTMDGLPYAYLR